MGRPTTHVLDTAAGRPAAGIGIEVRRAGDVVARAVTDADGRTEAPLVHDHVPLVSPWSHRTCRGS